MERLLYRGAFFPVICSGAAPHLLDLFQDLNE